MAWAINSSFRVAAILTIFSGLPASFSLLQIGGVGGRPSFLGLQGKRGNPGLAVRFCIATRRERGFVPST